MRIDVLLFLLIFSVPARTCDSNEGCDQSNSFSSFTSSSTEQTQNSSSSTQSSSSRGSTYSYSYSSSTSSRHTSKNSFRSNHSSEEQSSLIFRDSKTEEAAASRESEKALEENENRGHPPRETPAQPVEDSRNVEIPPEFYPCGYPKPVDPDHPETRHRPAQEGTPCPVSTETVRTPPSPTQPAPVVAEKQKTEPEASIREETPPRPVARSNIVPAPKSLVTPKPPVKRRYSHVTAKKVKALVDSKDVSGLAKFVTETDDIYGLTLGLTFDDEQREDEIRRTAFRRSDKDVVVLKALATAALAPEAKLKVIEIMILTATSPEGYHFNQHRELVEQFVTIFYDDALLHQVIESDPQGYARRRLTCVSCTPVNSYVCAHCWPKSICNVYFWCKGASAPHSSSPSPATRPGSDGSTSQSPSSNPSKSKKRNRRSRRRKRNRKQTRKAQSSQNSSPP